MGVLAKKLWRTILSTKGQFLAVVAVVTVGITVFISFSTTYYNLSRSQELFYREYNFADYYFHVVRAPEKVARQVESVPGVIRATGRLQKDVPVIREGYPRATARLVGYPLPLDTEVNRLHLVDGRMFEKYPQGGGIEILTDPGYAAANGLSGSGIVTVAAEGRRIPLHYVGSATSPENIYIMKDSSTLMPDPQTFGIIMLPIGQAQQILNMPGQINQLVVKLAPGADEEKVAGQVKALLEPYGNLGSFPRKNQYSHAILQGELDQLRIMSRFFPAIFLGIAAAIQFIMLGRMIRSQRLQIGVMKALGYGSRPIMLHYTGYALAVALAGGLLGAILGIMLASLLSSTYARFFNLPETLSGVSPDAIAYGLIISLAVAAAAGLTASRSILAINPAESMRPEPPRSTANILLERFAWFWKRLDPSWRMSFRSVIRKKGRFAVTVVGVAFAVAMLVMSVFTRDSVNYMMDKHFNSEQRYDLLVRFDKPVKDNALLSISRLNGVIKTEPIMEIPVKFSLNGRSRNDLLTAIPGDATLKEVTGKDGQPVSIPDAGVLISEKTADMLGARVGDRVEVETMLGLGPARKSVIVVAGINRQLVGSSSFISPAQAGRLLQESRLATGAMLKADPGLAGQLENALNEINGIVSVSSRKKELDSLNQNMDSMIYSISVMVLFAGLLGFAIIYNNSVISLAERRRELASLRVLGFTSREVSGLLLRENFVQSLMGITLGLPLGRILTGAYVEAMSTDLFTLPVIISPTTYLLSAIGGILFTLAAHLLAAREVNKLDLVDVLKNRD